MVVVVIGGLKRIAFGILVVDKTARIGDKSLGRILRLEAIDLTVDEIRVGVLRGRDIISHPLVLGGFVIAKILIGETAIVTGDRPFGSKIKALEVLDVKIDTENILAGRQPVFEADKAHVRAVADIAVRAFDQQKYRFVLAVDL